MKKLHTSLLLLAGVLSLGTLTSCGAGDGKIHVKFWHTMGQTNQAMLDRMIADFETANPDIKIEAFSQGNYDSIALKIRDSIPAGTTPTMSFCYPDNVATYLSSGAIENMADYVNNEEYGFTAEEKGVEDFLSTYWDEGQNYEEPGLYSLPYAKSTEALFYNADMFKLHNLKVPTTWDEMWEVCRQIKEIEDPVRQVPLGYDSDSNLFITLCEQRGIPYTDRTKTGGERFEFVNSQAKAMVNELHGYYKEGLLTTKGVLANSAYTSTLFTEGKCWMSVGSTGGTTYNKSLNFDIGVAPIPGTKQADGSINNKVVSQGPSVCFFKRAKADQKIAAWKFYKHITSTVNSAYYAIQTGYEPVRASSYEHEFYQRHLNKGNTDYICPAQGGNLLATVAILTKEEYKDRYFYSDVFPGSDIARDEVGGIITNVFLGTKNVDKAFQDALKTCIYLGQEG